MFKYEELMALHDELEYEETNRLPPKMDGAMVNGTIYLNERLHYYDKNAIVGEELGHFYTAAHRITDYNDINEYKYELKGRRLGYEINLPISKLIDCFEMGMDNVHQVSEHMELQADYIWKALDHYKVKYNNELELEKYKIKFDPFFIERKKDKN